jgi:hypothetical protein
MTSRRLVVAFDAHDPAQLAHFGAGVLRRVVQDAGGALLPGGEPQRSLQLVALATAYKFANGPVTGAFAAATPIRRNDRRPLNDPW